MRLLDTMVMVYVRTADSPFHDWARRQIADAVWQDGAALNAVSLAELCADDAADLETVSAFVLSFGVKLFDLPADAAGRCGEAYRAYRHNRKRQSGKDAHPTPQADFFIGAHAELEGWELVTNDAQRFRTYFPSVKLITP